MVVLFAISLILFFILITLFIISLILFFILIILFIISLILFFIFITLFTISLILFLNIWINDFPNPYILLVLLRLLNQLNLILNDISRLNSLLNNRISLQPLRLTLLEYLQYLFNTILELLNRFSITFTLLDIIIETLNNINLLIINVLAGMFSELIMDSI